MRVNGTALARASSHDGDWTSTVCIDRKESELWNELPKPISPQVLALSIIEDKLIGSCEFRNQKIKVRV